MGSCIICGTSVDGRICELHQEDVVFEFRGSRPGELTPGRYYRGTVDGFAEFGVFVDIGDSVTGLLHKSELDQRLESLDWDAGDTVFVKVQNVRDNGNVDLGWSIRQAESEFRGTLIDDPEADTTRLKEDEEGNEDGGSAAGDAADPSTPSESESTPETWEPTGASTAAPETTDDDAGEGRGAVTETSASESPASETPAAESTAESVTAESTAEAAESAAAEREESEESAGESAEPTRATVGELDDRVGDRVRLEGEIVTARQTSGPTVFELRDETGTVDCAAFEEAGVRAYPEVEEGDVVRLDGEVERRRGELQVETDALVVLEAEERDTVAQRMEDAMVQRARPETVDPLATDPAVEAVSEPLRDVATAVRRAVLESRPIVVRHSATVDGYVAGVAIERATLPLIREEHRDSEAEYHYFDRRPLEESVYDMDDATGDVTGMLSNRERHDEKLPLFVFVASAGTTESLDGLELLDVYGARRAVIDERGVDPAIAETVDALVDPLFEDGPETTATALAANVAAHVNEDVRDDLRHLPAVSFWEETPEPYAELAADAGYDADAVRELREAVALEAYYQSYEDKRELIIDLLFGELVEGGLAGHVSEQFRTKMGAELDTADANLERREVDGRTILVLDVDAYTHQYEFPPTTLLLDELHRRHRDDVDALVGFDTDDAYVRADADVDVRTLAERAAEAAPNAGIDGRGPREGRIEFLAGERDAVEDALLSALVESL